MSNPTEIPFGQGGARVPSSLVQKGLQFANNIGLDALTALVKTLIEQQLPAPYELPTASAETLGGVKVGDGLQISEAGVLSSSGGGNEPLIVEGEFEEGAGGEFLFTPSGSITRAEAKEALEGGRNVIVKGEANIGLITANITGCANVILSGHVVDENQNTLLVYWS